MKKTNQPGFYLGEPNLKDPSYNAKDRAVMRKIYTSVKALRDLELYETGVKTFSRASLLKKLALIYRDNLQAYAELGKLEAARKAHLKGEIN